MESIKIYLTSTGWSTPEDLAQTWTKMIAGDSAIEFVSRDKRNEDSVYWVIVNKPHETDSEIPYSRSILLRMEPFMEKRPQVWGEEWANPDIKKFMYVIGAPSNPNFLEWHVSFNYDQLMNTSYKSMKTEGNAISVIVSDKYMDIGQVKRIDFVRYLQQHHPEIELHVYGNGCNKFGLKNFRGPLPSYHKENGLVPYKYSFNCENNQILNYVTEKLYDGILCETFVFYNGAPNVAPMFNMTFDQLPFCTLELDDFNYAANQIKKAIESNAFDENYDKIVQLKKYCLSHLSLSKRFQQIIKTNSNNINSSQKS